jgi:hypothetical protein
MSSIISSCFTIRSASTASAMTCRRFFVGTLLLVHLLFRPLWSHRDARHRHLLVGLEKWTSTRRRVIRPTAEAHGKREAQGTGGTGPRWHCERTNRDKNHRAHGRAHGSRTASQVLDTGEGNSLPWQQNQAANVQTERPAAELAPGRTIRGRRHCGRRRRSAGQGNPGPSFQLLRCLRRKMVHGTAARFNCPASVRRKRASAQASCDRAGRTESVTSFPRVCT